MPMFQNEKASKEYSKSLGAFVLSLLENPFQKSPVSTLHQKDILSFTVFYRFSSTNSSLRFFIVTAINPSMGESKKDRKKNPTPDRPLEEAQTPQKMLNKNQLSKRKNIITISVSIFHFRLGFIFVFLRFDSRL
jgi:hypothetical protein